MKKNNKTGEIALSISQLKKMIKSIEMNRKDSFNGDSTMGFFKISKNPHQKRGLETLYSLDYPLEVN